MNKRQECPNIKVNLQDCTCTYVTCERREKCCECIRYHTENEELPGCLFSPEVKRTYDRAVKKFVETQNQ